MSTVLLRIAATITTATMAGTAALAQQPRISNGRVVPQAGASLQQTFRSAVDAQADVGWIGYAVPVVDRNRTMCCFGSTTTRVDGHVVMSDGHACCAMCALEPAASGTAAANRGDQQSAAPIKLEGPDRMLVLFRIVSRRVDRVRVFSEECPLDAGGRDVAWLTGVRPSDSVALLESLVTPQAERRTTDGAVSAIALHDDPAADASLERLLAPDQPHAVRENIPFWLGHARGRRGLEVLQRVVRVDPSADVKKKAVFGISQSSDERAVDVLIDSARTSVDSRVRGEAIFWLAQKAGNKAAGAITERIEQDPDTDVKKRAVFALSQLPKSEGVPLLIQVARSHSNPAVKKQAMFWLGQSNDPRALDFFAEVLK